MLFQFHYGTIKRNWGSNKVDSINNLYFNSTMVRLKAPGPLEQIPKKIISIPLWYD